jgi:hypothetical protein
VTEIGRDLRAIALRGSLVAALAIPLLGFFESGDRAVGFGLRLGLVAFATAAVELSARAFPRSLGRDVLAALATALVAYACEVAALLEWQYLDGGAEAARRALDELAAHPRVYAVVFAFHAASFPFVTRGRLRGLSLGRVIRLTVLGADAVMIAFYFGAGPAALDWTLPFGLRLIGTTWLAAVLVPVAAALADRLLARVSRAGDVEVS